jgi:hypothetical protein
MDRRERQDEPVEALRAALDGKQAEIWTALPGIVAAFDATAMTVSVQPAIKGLITGEDGSVRQASLPLLINVPVIWPQGGGFVLTFPIAAGDECLVVFASRCIDGWWQSGGVQAPTEQRMHDLSDGFAIVGPRSQARRLTPAADTQAVQLRSVDGDQHIAIAPGGEISVRATTSITLEAPLLVLKGAISMQAIDGGATTATLDGQIVVTEDVVAGGISLHGHTHRDVQPGPGSTGVPQ